VQDQKIAAFGSSYRGIGVISGIVTKSAKGVYQNPLCLPPPHPPKIHLADKANAINNDTAPTKAVNPALQVTTANDEVTHATP
jgi:hypothetical protein